jgi:hypothetical protein
MCAVVEKHEKRSCLALTQAAHEPSCFSNQQKASSTMAQARPISMVMWAMLMFLLGGLSIFASLGGFVTANQAMSHPLASLQVGSSAIAMLILLAALLNLGGGVLGIMAGIGLLKVARWGWGVTLAYAIVLLGYEGLMLHLMFDAFGWLYPILLIIFLHTPQWKNAFAARQLQGLHG